MCSRTCERFRFKFFLETYGCGWPSIKKFQFAETHDDISINDFVLTVIAKTIHLCIVFDVSIGLTLSSCQLERFIQETLKNDEILSKIIT